MGTCAAEIQCEPIVSLDQQVLGAKAGPLTATEHSVEDVPERRKTSTCVLDIMSQTASQNGNGGANTLKTPTGDTIFLSAQNYL